jgi:hypothetical protein
MLAACAAMIPAVTNTAATDVLARPETLSRISPRMQMKFGKVSPLQLRKRAVIERPGLRLLRSVTRHRRLEIFKNLPAPKSGDE